MQRGTRIDLEAAEFGFIENLECSLTIKLQGECHTNNGSNESYCQPLLGFGDDFKYFVASYLAEHSTNEIRVYPEYGEHATLAEGDITSILTNYDGQQQGRDDQFYDAVTGLGANGPYAFTPLQGLDAVASWPIQLKIRRSESEVNIDLGNGNAYWTTSFGASSSLYFGILDRLKREDLKLSFGGFTVSLITITRSCSNPQPSSVPLSVHCFLTDIMNQLRYNEFS